MTPNPGHVSREEFEAGCVSPLRQVMETQRRIILILDGDPTADTPGMRRRLREIEEEVLPKLRAESAAQTAALRADLKPALDFFSDEEKAKRLAGLLAWHQRIGWIGIGLIINIALVISGFSGLAAIIAQLVRQQAP